MKVCYVLEGGGLMRVFGCLTVKELRTVGLVGEKVEERNGC